MIFSPRRLRLAAAPALIALLAPLGLSAPASVADAAHPTNAAAIFKWGNYAWGDEFHSATPLPGWEINKPDKVANQNGMLTLESARRGTVTALASDQAAKYGRWEARVRARRYSFNRTPYRAIWELVPARRYKCGTKSIVLADYTPGDATATGAVRTRPVNEFGYRIDLDLGTDVFHTYAVEVTKDHISWFVDTEVIRTERRPEALSGVKLQPRFRLQATRGEKMDHGRMQMDWARYYTLARPNQKSIEAPQMDLGINEGACEQPAGEPSSELR
ncbi:hypothetical protein BH09ACT12_BH09ACT12_16170 [soil metagenome]